MSKKIYIVLTKSKTLISKYIDLVTHDEFTHSSISFNDTIQPMYSFGRKYTFLNFPSGLKIEPFDSGFYKFYKNSKVGVFSLEVSDNAYNKMKNYVEGMLNDEKKWRYNVVGLSLARFGIKSKQRNHKRFCSEFVACVLKESEEIEITKNPSLYHPVDFTRIEGVKCEFKGEVKDLVNMRF